MKLSLRILGAAVLGGLVLVWLSAGWLGSATKVDAVRARRERIAQCIDERAVTRLPETYLISMPFSARVEAIALREGMAVHKGQVVARLVPRDLELQVRELQATVERLRAAIEEAADTSVEQTGLRQSEQFVRSTQATVAAAEKRVDPAKTRWDYAQREYERTKALWEKKVRTDQELERADLERVQSERDYWQDVLILAAMRSMEAATNLMPTMVQQYIARKSLTKAVLEKQLIEAQVRLEQAELNRSRGTMTSPVDGIVLNRFVTSEAFLPAGTRLLEIGRLEDLEVEADLLSVEVGEVKPGHPVEIYGPAIGPLPARGTVTRIFPAGFSKVSSLGVEQQRVKVIVRFDPNDLQRLRSERNLGVGYRVRVKIETATSPNALVVPRSALFRGPASTWQVYAVRRGRAEVVGIRVGILNDELAEVLEGLEEGEPVIPAPDTNLSPGQRVIAVLGADRPATPSAPNPTVSTHGD